MQTCNKCRISIRGQKRCCPLCGGRIEGESENPAFPIIEKGRVTTELFLRICFFVTAVSEIVLGAITVLWRDIAFVTGIVAVSILFALGDICVAVYFRGNIIKLVTIQTYIVMLALYGLDKHFSGLKWSLQFAIPALFVVLMVVTLIIGKAEGLLLGDYVIYIVIDVVLGILQMVPVINGVNTFPIGAVISASIMMVMAAFVIIFRFKDLKNASIKYLNM